MNADRALAPNPPHVGLAVAALCRLRGAGSVGAIIDAAGALDPSLAGRTELISSLQWLEGAQLTEQVGSDEWRLVPDLLEAFSLRAQERVLPEGQLSEIAAWAVETKGIESVAEAVAAAFGTAAPLPTRVAEALAELAEFEPSRATRDRYSLARAFEALEAFQPESFAIYRMRRLTAGNRPTLDEIGKQHGVTRERIRQREREVERFIEKKMAADPDWPIRLAAERIRSSFGSVALADELPEASAMVDPGGSALPGHPHRLTLLLQLAGGYRAEGRWLSVGPVALETDEVLRSLTEAGPVPVGTACQQLAGLGVREALRLPWIEDRAGFRVVGDLVIQWGRSMNDKAVAMLSVIGEPVTLDELYERVGEDKNIRSFKGQVQGDPRIRRLGLKHYGLAAWGGEEYTTIVDEMTQELERQGGSMNLDELAATLAQNFGVSESSIRMYADGPQFHVDESRRITRRVGELPVPPSAPLEMTRRCFRLEQGWAFRRTVDHDVLRGSGGALPIAFAKELGLRPGESVEFDSPYGPVNCSWPAHMAHIGSIRAAAEQLGAGEGDHLFVVHFGERSLDLELLRREEAEALGGYERLARECGGRRAGDDIRFVATALGLDPDESYLGTAIRLRLRERGDRDLAELVPETESGDDEDVLDVLASLGE